MDILTRLFEMGKEDYFKFHEDPEKFGDMIMKESYFIIDDTNQSNIVYWTSEVANLFSIGYIDSLNVLSLIDKLKKCEIYRSHMVQTRYEETKPTEKMIELMKEIYSTSGIVEAKWGSIFLPEMKRHVERMYPDFSKSWLGHDFYLMGKFYIISTSDELLNLLQSPYVEMMWQLGTSSLKSRSKRKPKTSKWKPLSLPLSEVSST